MHGTLALPLSAHDLRQAVRSAQRYDPARLDRVLRIDRERDRVEVQTSASWASLAALLGPHAGAAALAAEHSAIGEAVAANAPGPDGLPVVAHIESLALVTPDGTLRQISRENHPKLFALAVGGQGLFGAAYSVTLRLSSLLCSASAAVPGETLELASDARPGRALQLLLPPEHLERFLAEARTRCADWRIAILGVDVRRTLPESETVLCWARREYAAIALHIGAPGALGGAVRATQLRGELIGAAIALGGSFRIACTREATRAQVEACYPQLKSFLAEKRRLDPEEKLSNQWLLHHRSLLAREACKVRWNRQED
jgi:FAD/FMN-containing dehydrogenase